MKILIRIIFNASQFGGINVIGWQVLMLNEGNPAADARNGRVTVRR